MMTPDQFLADYADLAEHLAVAVGDEMDLEGAATRREAGGDPPSNATPNDLTGKAYSASSAETAAETDLEYGASLRRRRDPAVEKIRLSGQVDAARLRVTLALEVAGRR